MLLLTDSETGQEFVLEAYSRRDLMDMLKDQPVLISFRKVTNDRYRLIFGTRDLSRIPKEDHPTGQGLPFDPIKAGVIPIYDLVKKAWRSFKIKMVRRAEPKTVEFLRRLLQSRKALDRIRLSKYKKDSANPIGEGYDATPVLEMVELPSILELGCMLPLNESDDKWIDRTTAWLNRHMDDATDAARRAREFLSAELSHIAGLPSKLATQGKFLQDYVKSAATGRTPTEAERSLAKEVTGEFLRYIGLSAIALMPSPPGFSLALLVLLRALQSITSIPVFPKSWTEKKADTKKRLTFSEMAAGAVGGGSEGNVSEKEFHTSTVNVYRSAMNAVSDGVRPVNYGKVKGFTLYGVEAYGRHHIFATSEDWSAIAQGTESIIFSAYLAPEDHLDMFSSPVYNMWLPHIKPTMQRKGLVADFYSILNREFIIAADNVQSKQARFLWAKLVREKKFRFVYVFNEISEEIVDEISGNETAFLEYMEDGDEDIRFIASFRTLDV